MSAKLIYIVSAGHSGSTLLDLVTGSIPGCFSTGELIWMPWQLYRRESASPTASRQRLCSCGKGFHECEVWTKILETISAKRDIDVFKKPFSFRINLLQSKKYERGPLSMARAHRILYSLANHHKVLSPLIPVYRKSLSGIVDNNWLLFDTISACFNVEYIVDSSKSVERFSLLYRKRPADTYLIVLIRDIRAIAFSDQKRGLDPVKRAKGWVRQYNRIYSFINRLPDLRYICINYENLVDDPESERLRIGRFIGNQDIKREFRLDTTKTHTVAGNKMRYEGDIQITPDIAWKTGLTNDALKRVNTISERLHPFWTI